MGGANGDTLFANENGDEQILYKFDLVASGADSAVSAVVAVVATADADAAVVVTADADAVAVMATRASGCPAPSSAVW